ncbi:unnamed protein product [Caretta caretta]
MTMEESWCDGGSPLASVAHHIQQERRQNACKISPAKGGKDESEPVALFPVVQLYQALTASAGFYRHATSELSVTKTMEVRTSQQHSASSQIWRQVTVIGGSRVRVTVSSSKQDESSFSGMALDLAGRDSLTRGDVSSIHGTESGAGENAQGSRSQADTRPG